MYFHPRNPRAQFPSRPIWLTALNRTANKYVCVTCHRCPSNPRGLKFSNIEKQWWYLVQSGISYNYSHKDYSCTTLNLFSSVMMSNTILVNMNEIMKTMKLLGNQLYNKTMDISILPALPLWSQHVLSWRPQTRPQSPCPPSWSLCKTE